MKKKKDRSYLIILLLLFIIFLSSFYLYQNITAGARANDNMIVGTLTFKNKNIERKYDSDVIWETIDSGLLIRNRDTIRSGEYSDAVLTLKDKTRININENSMIYVDVSENDINLNFAYGSMSLSKKDDGSSEVTLKIKSGNNTVEVKDSDIALEKKGQDELSFQVNSGSVKLTNGNQEKELKENESANLTGSDIQIAEVNLSLLSPPDATVITEKSDSIPINFRWSAKNTTKLHLELATDSRFEKIFKIYNVDKDSFTTSLKQGTYYWRLTANSNKPSDKSKKEISAFRRFTLYSIYPPLILSPKNNQVFSFSSVIPIIRFNWNRLETARNYKLEISKNPGFSEIIKTTTTNQTSASVDKLEVGKYYARLIAEPARDELKQQISDPISFSLEKKTELDSPKLISPSNGIELSALIIGKSGYLFQVKDSPEIKNYTFEISNGIDFAKKIIEMKSNSNQIRIINKLSIGNYYWRVFGNTKEGKNTPYSEIGNFLVRENQNIELIYPRDNSLVDLKENPINFKWKRLNYKTNFILEVSDAADFSTNIQKTNTSNFFISYKLPSEGKYFWRVISLAEDESILSKSSIFSFQLSEIKQLTPIYPLPNQKVDMSPLNSLNFRWEENPKVEAFLFELYSIKYGSKSLITKSKIKNSSFVFRDLSKLDEGNFIWTLQESKNEEDESLSGRKVTVPFKIYLSKKPGTPNIKTPKKMYVE